MTVRDSSALRDAIEENAKIQTMIAGMLENTAIQGTSGDDLHRMAPTVTIDTELTTRNSTAKPAAFTITVEDGGIAHHPELVAKTVIDKLKEIPELSALITADVVEHHGKKQKPYYTTSEKDTHGIKIHFPMEEGGPDKLITALAKRAETLQTAAQAPNATPIPTPHKQAEAGSEEKPCGCHHKEHHSTAHQPQNITHFPSPHAAEITHAKNVVAAVLKQNGLGAA